MQTVTYADIFDFPLTRQEVHTYLVCVEATRADVEAALRRLTPRHLATYGAYVMLPGRHATVKLRTDRAESAPHQWRRARHYGLIIARLPFVRMVAVTGALAVNNAPPGDDIDYLIITQPGRLWLTRAMVIGFVHLAARRGDVLCPNFFLSADNLTIPDHNLFTAHELAQMVPLAGHATYHTMLQANPWAASFLPNAPTLQAPPSPADAHRLTRRAAEGVLGLPLFDGLERWEMRRKVAKFARQMNALGIDGKSAEACFTPSCCRGHFSQHGSKTLDLLDKRLVGKPK